MRRVGASAPGKAILCGEYAVLQGAPAIVSAVDRRVFVKWSDRELPMPPEVMATLDLARRQCGDVPGSLELDASALHRERIKLGLGSSAAAAAASAAAVFATHGHDLRDAACRSRIFDCAYRGHASVAPRGSGIDVAASTFGGFLRAARADDHLDIRPVNCPPTLQIRLIWTGHAARTSDLLAALGEFRERDRTRYDRLLSRLAEIGSAFAAAFEAGLPRDVVHEAISYGNAMQELGDAARAPIVDAPLRRVADLAADFSGGAKPSGAGGGDVAIAFFTDEEAADGFEMACKNEGLRPIDVLWAATGVRAG